MLKLKLPYFGHLMQKTVLFEKIGCWERLKAGEEDNGGWDGWMASLTQWTWVWVSSGSWWWTGRPGMLQFMGSQRVGHDWATELNWTPMWLYLETGSLRRIRAQWDHKGGSDRTGVHKKRPSDVSLHTYKEEKLCEVTVARQLLASQKERPRPKPSSQHSDLSQTCWRPRARGTGQWADWGEVGAPAVISVEQWGGERVSARSVTHLVASGFTGIATVIAKGSVP